MLVLIKKLKKPSSSYWLSGIILSLFLFLNNQPALASDIVGLQVYKNFNHWSPIKWYQENVPYPGSPQSVQVDGYEAVIDGRTTYVAAVNKNNSDIYYTNIYLISYNEGADEKTINIYQQLVDNWYFNVNLDPESGDKEKIIRDTKRIADLQDLASALGSYYQQNQSYPVLGSGTFVPGQSTSKWPSWQQTLAPLINIASPPTDPTNEFSGCTEIPEPQASGYDPATCWNEVTDDFTCLTGSMFYIYNTANSTDYDLATDAEIFTISSLGNYSSLDDHLNISGYINGQPMCEVGAIGAYCGNGQLNDPPEDCELGYTRNYCDVTFGNQNWHQELITGCNNNCTWFDPGYTQAQCGGYCNDGALQGIYEECDDSLFLPGWSCPDGGNLACDNNCQVYCTNGQPPYSGSCGNGVLEYPEQCDYLGYNSPDPALSSQYEQYSCTAPPATNTCLDTGGWCGNGTVQATYGEQCDGAAGMTGWNCTEAGTISCPATPDSQSCLRDCTEGCPYQGQCGNNIKQNTGSCSEFCDGNNFTNSNLLQNNPYPHTVCNNICSDLESCQPLYDSCNGPLYDEDGCEANLSNNLNNCGYCGNQCDYNGGNGQAACNTSECKIDCDDNYHCSGDSYPYYQGVYSSGFCSIDETCVLNCGDYNIGINEICDDGQVGTIGPFGQPGHNGQFGFCNATCSGIEGLGTPLFYDNFENISYTNTNWNWTSGYCPNVLPNPPYECQWTTELTTDTYKRKSANTSYGSNYPRDAWVTNSSVVNLTNVNELIMLEFTPSNDHDSLLIARRSGSGQNESYYALWTDYGFNGTAIVRMNNSSRTMLANTDEIFNGNWWVQLLITNEGSDVRIKARWWPVGTAMPSSWCTGTTATCLNILDSAAGKITSSGNIGIAGWIDATFYYDNYMVYNP